MRSILTAMGLVALLASCNPDFLETEPLTQKVDANFYRTPEDAHMALAAIYAAPISMNQFQNFFFVSELMSDHRFGGGRIHNETYNAINMFKKNSPNQYHDAWIKYYQGIFRANMLLKHIDQIEWESESQRGQVLGEALFMRALMYFDLARMFERVPLLTAPTTENVPQAEPHQTYAQIAADLKQAIEVMPATPIAQIAPTRLGHATRWAAQGLMARVFLFYTGFYRAEALPLPDGGQVTRQQVIGWLEDCIAHSGHALISDFRNLWPYAAANENYGFANLHDLEWIGEGGANTETVFAFRFGNHASHETSVFYSNQVVLYFGMRDQSNIPIGRGWGSGTVNPQLWAMWPDYDPRKQGSIFNVNPAWGPTELDWISGYVWGGADQWQESGMWQKKYIPINVAFENDDPSRPIGYSVYLFGTASDFQLQNTQDLVIIRFADILLMASELKEDATYLNQVRARVGLDPVEYSLENLQRERIWELSFEGVRYWDILRWGIAEQAFAQVRDVPVYHARQPSTTSIIFRPITRGFLPIPQTEIDLSEGLLTQNPGWDTPCAEF